MYCVYLGKAVQTVNPPNASVGTSQLADNAVTTAKITDANITSAKLASGVLPTNTPMFMAKPSSNISFSNDTTTNITMTEVFDSDGAFASNTFTVPSGKAGKYWIGAKLQFYIASQGSMFIIYVKKNGSQALYGREQFNANSWYQKSLHVFGILDLAVGDAITVDIYCSISGTGQVNGSESESWFQGYKLIT
jgi:hypothetical protein